MKKFKITIKPNKNVVLVVMLCLGLAWSVFNIWSASPEPGHLWSKIGDSGTEVLTVSRGGTSASTLTDDNVLLGGNAGTFQFVATGTAGNVLKSDGITWRSSQLTGLVALLYSDEADSSTLAGSTTETVMKYWVMNIDPSIYRFYILEADVNANHAIGSVANTTLTWNFNEGANLKKSIEQRGMSVAASAGPKTVSTLSATTTNALPASANLTITADPGASDASITMTVQAFRVYGVK